MTRLAFLLAAPAAAALFVPAPAAAQSPCGAIYTVRPGDTLYSIAQRCRTPIAAIMQANRFIRSPSRIAVGWRLTIPGAAPPQRPQPEPRDRYDPRDRHRDHDCERRGDHRDHHDDDRYDRPRERPDRPPYDRGDRDRAGMAVTGVITREGVECPALRTDRGELYTLAGDLGRYGPGDRVTVRGRVAEVSYCQQGTTIDVRDIAPARWSR